MIIKVAKLHKYPAEIPTGWAVGFDITFDNDRRHYIDAITPLDLTEEEAVQAAWKIVKDSVKEKEETIGTLPKIVGSIFNPPIEEEEEEEAQE
jgi:hypothetical protein